MGGETDRIEHPIFARAYARFDSFDRLAFGAHRRWLADGLEGRIVDLGAGDGAMIPYVEDAIGDPARLEYHAVEPDSTMRSHARDRARRLGFPATFHDARAESLPFDDDSVDVVVSSLVFCSIADPEAAVDEIARVLRPGGELRVLEHVGGDGWYRRVQSALTPAWKRVAGGCHLDRDTIERFEDHDAFEAAAFDRTGARTYPAAPVVRGRLRRRAD
ncbi:class I SAM-dependent methyltransferase [Halovivax gelatinilyticus]|uniref:class I SAM-dependent methyltransferase n=1 Tax=Halovivax gelatinilyticus TaxID=2961597 RepID=UPI0020CA92CE|nr:class I SAM-dependent methyltransferase [Halovivax gelatinilyticus]